MADRNIVIQEMRDNRDGWEITLNRSAGSVSIVVRHADPTTGIVARDSVGREIAPIPFSSLSAPQQTALNTAITAIIAGARPILFP